MISQLVKEHAGKKGITEAIKATDQMDLVRRQGEIPAAVLLTLILFLLYDR